MTSLRNDFMTSFRFIMNTASAKYFAFFHCESFVIIYKVNDNFVTSVPFIFACKCVIKCCNKVLKTSDV